MTAIVFLICFLIGCAMALARHPIYGLLTYVAVYYLHPPSRWWGAVIPDLRWSLLAALITFIAVHVHGEKLNDVTKPYRRSLIVGYIIFTVWLIVQSMWALAPETHRELLVLYAKYALLIWLITRCIDTQKHLLWFCWAHVIGCTYLGWIAFTEHDGGRFESFGGSDFNEANAGALQLLTGTLVGAALFLLSKIRERIALMLCLPLIVNGIILTVSRSAFLAAATAGIVFNLLTPKRTRKLVMVLSAVAVVLFAALTNPEYWMRIGTLKAVGAEVEGVDTGSSRLVIISAQWQMFQVYPLGCGHRCTAVLSPQYLDDIHLTGPEGNRGRSSHNTPMSLLVEQGIPGIIFYGLFIAWTGKAIFRVKRYAKGSSETLVNLLPGIVACSVAIMVGDFFVDYLKSEGRVWFAGLLVVMAGLAAANGSTNARPEPAAAPKAGPVTNRSGRRGG